MNTDVLQMVEAEDRKPSEGLLNNIRSENLNVYRASPQRLREDVGQESRGAITGDARIARVAAASTSMPSIAARSGGAWSAESNSA
jgi:hypothetical protein